MSEIIVEYDVSSRVTKLRGEVFDGASVFLYRIKNVYMHCHISMCSTID